MENVAKTTNIPVPLAIRSAEALCLVHDLGESLLRTGDHQALAKLRQLKSLLALPPSPTKKSQPANSQEGAVEGYRQEVMELLTALAFELMAIEGEVGDCALEEIALRAETIAERIHCYLDTKIRSSLQDIVAGGCN